MLHQTEKQRILKFLCHCCSFGLLPAQVNLSSGDLVPIANGPRSWMCHLSILLVFLNAMYKIGTLGNAYFFMPDTPLHHMVIHAALAIAPPVYVYWYYVLYIQYPSVFGIYVKTTLTGIFEEDAGNQNERKSWWFRVKERTPQDLFVMSLPYMQSAVAVAIIIALICYPSMNFLLYAAVPEGYQTWPIFGILLLEEFRFLVVLISVSTPIWTLQVISFDVVNNEIQRLMNSMRRAAGARSYENIYRRLRYIQVYVSITNLINCFLIFTWKIVCMTVCSGAGYAAIAHFNDHPLFGIMYYCILLDCSYVYILGYGKAFRIPTLFEKATQRAVLLTCNESSEASKVFMRQMRSIPRLGIKVGEFHTMERESSLIFIDFVLGNIVSMLVANRQG